MSPRSAQATTVVPVPLSARLMGGLFLVTGAGVVVVALAPALGWELLSGMPDLPGHYLLAGVLIGLGYTLMGALLWRGRRAGAVLGLLVCLASLGHDLMDGRLMSGGTLFTVLAIGLLAHAWLRLRRGSAPTAPDDALSLAGQ